MRRLKRFILGGILTGLLTAGSATAQRTDSVARPVAPLPRLGLRLSAGYDFASVNRYYQTSSTYWATLEANQWLWRRLSVGVGVMGLWQPENAYAYDRAGLAQGHLTVTAIQERRFSLNLRAGIYIRHGRSDWYRICDFGCSDDRYTIGGWLLGLYPTFPLNPRWSLDAAVELRADKAPFGFTGLGVKRRLWVR